MESLGISQILLRLLTDQLSPAFTLLRWIYKHTTARPHTVLYIYMCGNKLFGGRKPNPCEKEIITTTQPTRSHDSHVTHTHSLLTLHSIEKNVDCSLEQIKRLFKLSLLFVLQCLAN